MQRDHEAAAIAQMAQYWHPAFREQQGLGVIRQAAGSAGEFRHGTFDGLLAGEKETIAPRAQADAGNNSRK